MLIPIIPKARSHKASILHLKMFSPGGHHYVTKTGSPTMELEVLCRASVQSCQICAAFFITILCSKDLSFQPRLFLAFQIFDKIMIAPCNWSRVTYQLTTLSQSKRDLSQICFATLHSTKQCNIVSVPTRHVGHMSD